MGDWAEDKAQGYRREMKERWYGLWLLSGIHGPTPQERKQFDENEDARLAALLREVAGDRSTEAAVISRRGALAEVRRVVAETNSDVKLACITDEEREAVRAFRSALFARLEKL